MQTSGDSATSSKCRKPAMNICQNMAFLSFGIRIFQHLGVKGRSGFVPASGARILNLSQFSDTDGGLQDAGHARFVSCC